MAEARLCAYCGNRDAMGGSSFCIVCGPAVYAEVIRGLADLHAYLAHWLEFGRWLAGHGVDRL